MPPSIEASPQEARNWMRNNIRKQRFGHLQAGFLVGLSLMAAPLGAEVSTKQAPAGCTVQRGTLGEKDQAAPELSTEQMEVALARNGEGFLIIDARPYEEFAVSHIPGAVNVAPKPGLSMSQYTSDAVVIDAREAGAFQGGSLPGARNVRFDEVAKAKDDGRLPMLDHNTRIFVVGKDAAEARAVAQEIARNAFHNVSFFAGSVDVLMLARPRSEVPAP